MPKAPANETILGEDRRRLDDLLERARQSASAFLATLDDRPVAQDVPAIPTQELPVEGRGADHALDLFEARFLPWISGSAGPRYWAFVTGGATPAALVGDWLTSTFDQNLADAGESASRQIALEALAMVRDLLGLPDGFQGAFVSGATTSAIVALATARQWVGHARGIDISARGAAALGSVPVLSGAAHSSIYKALSVVGLGRESLQPVGTLPNREAVDLAALQSALETVRDEGRGPAIVIVNAGTVNTCDFDDIEGIAALRDRFPFWLHVDGAFGAVAAASERYRPLIRGLERADSITVDGHKWLNVPYDGAVILTRHFDLQGEAFQSFGPYLPTSVESDTFVHLTPENSQRLRALPLWMTLTAYGRDGYAALVERCCALAYVLGARIDADDGFRLLAPVRLNGICFTLRGRDGQPATAMHIDGFLRRLKDDGTVFLTPTTYLGVPAARISISNWRTEPADIERAWRAMVRARVNLDHD